MGQMSAYESNSNGIEAVQFTEQNKADVAKRFGFTMTEEGRVKNSTGVLINMGMWACRFGDGTVKVFTDEMFQLLFHKVEPPTYKLSDIPELGVPIKRKGWTDQYLKNEGYCFAMCDSAGPITPYTFTEEDFLADDWMLVE